MARTLAIVVIALWALQGCSADTAPGPAVGGEVCKKEPLKHCVANGGCFEYYESADLAAATTRCKDLSGTLGDRGCPNAGQCCHYSDASFPKGGESNCKQLAAGETPSCGGSSTLCVR